MNDLHCAETWADTVAIVSANGDVDLLTAPQLRDAVMAALEQRPTGLIIDFSEVAFLGSAGMEVLIDTHRGLPPSVRLAVVADGPVTSRPLQIVGLADTLDVVPTRDAALDAVGA